MNLNSFQKNSFVNITSGKQYSAGPKFSKKSPQQIKEEMINLKFNSVNNANVEQTSKMEQAKKNMLNQQSSYSNPVDFNKRINTYNNIKRG